jgi:hypothetical protein
MSAVLGPLENQGMVPVGQQTRVSAFLISAHGAHARMLAAMLPAGLRSGWQTELHGPFCRELEIVSLLTRATRWGPDPMLPLLAASWELEWLPSPAEGVSDPWQGLLIDTAAFGHALHAAIRPAALLPEQSAPTDPFVCALQRIEFESGRLMQAQILYLKGSELAPARDAVSAAVERRHAQVRRLWRAALRGIGVELT